MQAITNKTLHTTYRHKTQLRRRAREAAAAESIERPIPIALATSTTTNCAHCDKLLPLGWKKYCTLCMTAAYCDKYCQRSHWRLSHNSTCSRAYPPHEPVTTLAYARKKTSRSIATQVIEPSVSRRPTNRLTKKRVTAVQDAAWIQCACNECANPVSLAEECCDICELCWEANQGEQRCIKGPSGLRIVGEEAAVDPDHCRCTCPW